MEHSYDVAASNEEEKLDADAIGNLSDSTVICSIYERRKPSGRLCGGGNRPTWSCTGWQAVWDNYGLISFFDMVPGEI